MQGEIFLKANTGSFTNNTDKTINSSQAVNIETAAKINNNAQINSEKDITLNADADIHNNLNATITGGDGETIISAALNLYNQNQLTSAGSLHINTSGIENKGQIASGQDIAIETDTLQNKKGGVIYAGSGISINASDYIENIKANILAAGSITIQKAESQNNNRVTNYVGTIEAGGDITINTNTLENTGEDSGNYEVSLVHIEGHQWNSYGLMDEYVVTSTLYTDPSYITAGSDLFINNANIHNYGSAITAAGDINIAGGTLKNETAAISVSLTPHKHWGKKWDYEKCWTGLGLVCETRRAYHDY